jgi:methylase of polypeptide subunit release factors
LLEIGTDQASEVARLVKAWGGFEAPRVLQDLAGRERVMVSRRAEE